MFVYEFMAGIVEQMTGGDDAEAYDPHTHRKVERPTSYSDTMIHLLKGSVGAGVLAMADAVGRVGIIFSIVGILLIGFFATYCVQLLIAAQYELCKRRRRGYLAYPKSMLFALQEGPPCMRWSARTFYYFVDTVLVLWQLGICCIYCVFVAENIKQVCDFYGLELSLRLHLCFLIIPLTIIGLVKELKLLTPFSSVSNVVTLLGFIVVFFYLIEDDVTLEKEKLQLKNLKDIPFFIGTTLFALEAVGVVLALEYNMENPRGFVGLFGLFNIGMVIIMTLYLLMGIFGYLKYGDSIKASLTLNLPQDQKKAQVAKIIFAIAIFLTFPLQNFVAYNIVWRKLKKKLSGTRRTVIDYIIRIVLIICPCCVSAGKSRMLITIYIYVTLRYNIVTSATYNMAGTAMATMTLTAPLLLLTCIGLIAVAVPKLGPFIAFFGAFCLSLLAMVFPGLMDVCVWYPSNYGCCRYRLIRDILIMFIGMACLLSGCYTSLLEIAAASEE